MSPLYIEHPQTHQTVKLSGVPKLDQHTAFIFVDAQKTFMDVPENSGSKTELPVKGALARVPKIKRLAMLATAMKILGLASEDTHEDGTNPTTTSAFDETIEPYAWITLEMALEWKKKGLNPIKATAGFTLKQFIKYLKILKRRGHDGVTIWPPHSNLENPLHTIYEEIWNELIKNHNFQLVRKGSQQSRKVPGFFPESYSIFFLSTGESLGVLEMLRARGITRLVICGYAGDFCVGESALDAAAAGFEVWVVADAQACVALPEFQGSEYSSEQVMIDRELKAKNPVKFCTTDAILDAYPLAAA